MTAQFSRPGAIDLSALRKPASASPPGSAGGSASGAYVMDITSEQALASEVVERSLSVVVLLSFWAPSSPVSMQINSTLEQLADEFGGRFLFAKVNVEAQASLTSALGVPGAPLVVAVLRGQLAPLLQDPLPEPQMREVVQQVLQAAAANGVTGTAEPVAAPQAPAEADELEPRHAAAEQALLDGNVEQAIAAYEAVLADTPGDPEATAGLARGRLLQRTSSLDASSAREAAAQRPDDVSAQIAVADLDLLGGFVDDAFSRLIDVVRRTGGDDREAARKHLIELFTVVGDDDPRVSKARQRLASALF
jgi:putative thioredoxin